MCESRTLYRKICRTKLIKEKKTKAIELGRLSKSDPKKFWNKIKKKSKIETGSCDFFEHFKNFGNNITNSDLNAKNNICLNLRKMPNS